MANNISRRLFLQLGFSAAALAACRQQPFRAIAAPILQVFDDLLPQPDANGLRLPAGFRSRIVARSGQSVAPGSHYIWHAAPDGGGCFVRPGGGWIYVSNSEVGNAEGGVGAIAFDANANIESAYSILSGSSLNCSGGTTPWVTWLSCEETTRGLVWECDPFGREQPVALPALGRFKHEALCVDPENRQIYLTEDERDGRLYRFTPAGMLDNGRYDLRAGQLEVCQVTGTGQGNVVWLPILDPQAELEDTRYQQGASTEFAGGEGIDFLHGSIFFTTKFDNRVWQYDVHRNTLSLLYDAAVYAKSSNSKPLLEGVDALIASPDRRLWVAEDGDDMQVVVLNPGQDMRPCLQLMGHAASEITGLAFDPKFERLYFSSQRGRRNAKSDGVTYEVTGPFSTWGLS